MAMVLVLVSGAANKLVGLPQCTIFAAVGIVDYTNSQSFIFKNQSPSIACRLITLRRSRYLCRTRTLWNTSLDLINGQS
jgi:hypothetical protein